MITSGKGKHRVWLEQKRIGDDLIYVLGGGEQSHLGGIIVCEPKKKAKVIALKGHYDHIVLQPIAEAACKKYKVNVVALGGIHVEHATKNDIKRVVKNCKRLVKKL